MRLSRLLFLLAFGLAAAAQTFDFEDKNLPGWTRDRIFYSQPVEAATVRSDRLAPVTLGGDYWKGMRYPLGQHGNSLIATGQSAFGDSATGALTSPDFRIDANRLYMSLLIGGTDDIARERVELQISGVDGYTTIFAATGRSEALRQEVFRVPGSCSGRLARIRIVDNSTEGHINVDYIRFTGEPPDAWRTPVFGYADYHTHPMTYLAFGALEETPHFPIWGYPGGNAEDYGDTSLIACDISHCSLGHSGGPAAELFLDQAQSVSAGGWTKWWIRGIIPHLREGGPEFNAFPAFYLGAHQQMHITQIRRNYDGGLRLMVGLATDNLGAEYLTSRVENGKVATVPLIRSLEAQICGMLRMAELNHNWMEIAYTAEQARDIILRNKLAVIMGVEMDQLLELDHEKFPNAAAEVEYLWKLGIRAVTPIHAVDNKIGGPALFEDPYNWDNDLVHRPRGHVDLTADEAHDRTHHPATYFGLRFDVDPHQQILGSTVRFRLNATQERVALVHNPFDFFRLTPFIVSYKADGYDGPDPNAKLKPGERNPQGLTSDGRDYIRALMNKGMIVDMAHMSEASICNTYEVTKSGYPAIISHAHYRMLSHYDLDPNAPMSLLASEYDIGDDNLDKLKAAGGVVGTFTSQSSIDQRVQLTNGNMIDDEQLAKGLSYRREDVNERKTTYYPNLIMDCTMSSKSFAVALHYAVKNAGLPGVGMATDFTFIPGVSPRFGSDACAGFKAIPDLKYDKGTHHRQHYQPGNQRGAIVYDRLDQSNYLKPASLGHNAPLTPYTMGYRTYNFNIDGLAHFGLVPDLLQDVRNVDPAYPEDLEALFASAEAYLQMWEKSEQNSDCPASKGFCNPVPPALACHLPGAPACK